MARVLDPRTKLLLLIFAAFYIAIQMNYITELLLMIIFIFPFFVAGLYKAGFTFFMIYSVQLLVSMFLLPKVTSGVLVFILSYLTYGLRMLLPSTIAGVYSMKTTTVNEWIAVLKKMRMPNWLLIPLAVVTRFFPTIFEDYQHIRNAMAFRGIGVSFWDLARKPVQTLEFILIPLLMNATQVADDLSVSSLTKGLGLSGKHTTITKLRMTAYDWMYIILPCIPLILHLGGWFSDSSNY